MGLDMMYMLGGARSDTSVPNTPNGERAPIPLSLYFFETPIELNLNYFAVPPEQLYATQLSQLQEMGFFDTQENIRALSSTYGNVNDAVERLLGG